MARDASRLRMGYFPCPDAAIDDALKYLRPNPEARICDPCCGEGLAVGRLAAGLGIPNENVYGVELDIGRGDEFRKNLPGATCLSPCSFHHTKISSGAFGLLYCNSPFDDGDSARVELQFFARIPALLVPGGVCLFVCPEHVACRYDFRKAWSIWFEDVACWRFPAGHRRFQEVFVLGRRREKPERDSFTPSFACHFPESDMVIPSSTGPRVFEKTALTDDELVAAVDHSPLYRFLAPQRAQELARPPLALSVGHLALLLSSGQLDGLVSLPGGRKHVVRGTARKHEELSEETTESDKNGSKTTKVFTERIRLMVRAVTEEGLIHTLE